MNHGIKGRKFGRYSKHRKAMFTNLVKALLKHEQIVTTLPKAKDLRPIIEKLITSAKPADLAARRRIIARLGDQPEVGILFDNILPRFKDRPGGYTRILKYGYRQGDCAPMAVIQFVDYPERVGQEVSEEITSAE